LKYLILKYNITLSFVNFFLMKLDSISKNILHITLLNYASLRMLFVEARIEHKKVKWPKFKNTKVLFKSVLSCNYLK